MPGRSRRAPPVDKDAKQEVTAESPTWAPSNSASISSLEMDQKPAFKTIDVLGSHRGPGLVDPKSNGKDQRVGGSVPQGVLHKSPLLEGVEVTPDVLVPHTASRTTEEKKGNRQRSAKTTSGALIGGNVHLGHSRQSTEIKKKGTRTKGTTVDEHSTASSAGVSLNAANLKDSSIGFQRTKEHKHTTNKPGQKPTETKSSTTSGVGVSRHGVDVNVGRSGDKGDVGVTAGVGNREASLGVNVSRNLDNGAKPSASLSGGVKLNQVSERAINHESVGMDRTIRELAGEDAAAVGRTSGFKVAGGLGLQAGPIGLSGNAHYARESGVHFHTTHPGTTPDRMDESHGKRLQDMDGLGTAESLRDLDVAGLRAGEGYSMQSTASKGGGVGVSVMGIGVGGDISDTDVQQTVVHKTDDGYLVDISTMDQDTAAVNVNALGGAAKVEGSKTAGQASSVRFQADEATMMAFQKTGVLPGAMDELDRDDPRRVAYDRALASDKPLAGKELQAMQELATQVNAGLLNRDTRQDLPTAEGATYQQATRGKRTQSALKSSLLGFTLEETSTTTHESETRYREGDTQHTEYALEEDSQFFGSKRETASHRVNPRGDGVLSSTSTLDLGTHRRDLFKLAGDQIEMKGGNGRRRRRKMAGNADQVHFNLDERSLSLFTEDLVPGNAWERAALPYERRARSTESRIHLLQELVDNGVTPDQAMSFLSMQSEVARGPETGTIDPLRSALGETNPFDPFGIEKRTEHWNRVHALSNQAMGLGASGFEPGEAQSYFEQLSPSTQSYATGGVRRGREADLDHSRLRLPRLQKLGGVDSYQKFLDLPDAEQEDILRNARGLDRLPLLMADPNLERRDSNVTSWIKDSELGSKGADATLKAVHSYGQYLHDDTPSHIRESFEDALQIRRFKR